MALDIKAKIEELVGKIKGDKNLAAKFAKDPSCVIKELTGLDLPKDQIDQIAAGIQAKLGADKLSAAAGKLGGLFGKK